MKHLKDIIFDMGVGDIFRSENYHDFILNKHGSLVTVEGVKAGLTLDLLVTEGEIIPVEPLTTNQWAHNEYPEIRSVGSVDAACLGFEAGDKNGQLKRDLDYKDLRSIIESINENRSLTSVTQLKRALRNIKPL